MKYNQTLFTIIDLFNHLVTIFLGYFYQKMHAFIEFKIQNWGVLSNVNV